MNEAHALTDALLHCAIAGEATNPPATPDEGETWIVGSGATGAWAGNDGNLASLQGGNWLFVAPRDGMRIFNTATGQEWLFNGTWKIPVAPVEPSGGTNVDDEARAAIGELIAVLRATGVFPTT